MKSVLEVIQLAAGHLGDRRAAEEVVAAALYKKRLDLYLAFDQPLSEEELARCRTYLRRRATGEPIQQIIGHVDFFDCHIRVTPDVLIPRPETELLVEKVAKEIGDQNLTVWDICTGSGCVGIALKKACPQVEMVLADLSPEALAIAKENAAANEVEVELVQGDLLEPLAGRRCHLLVSNPPYVDLADYAGLQSEVTQFEPRQALVADDCGLAFYKRFATELPPYLHPGAKIWFEIGAEQGKPLLQLFHGPPWDKAKVEPDLSGHDRFFSLEIQP